MKTTKEQLTRQVRALQDKVDAYESDMTRLSAQVSVETRRASDALATVERLQKRVNDIFERRNFEAMTRVQLVSLIEEAINEARRKGLVEAEGLLSRHRELNRETDLEMMRGVVKTYQDRIKIAEDEQAAAKRAREGRLQFDTRPLVEKLQSAVPKAPPLPDWWSVGTPSTLPDYKAFDKKASLISAIAKSKEPGPATLRDGQKAAVLGDSGITYTLQRNGDVYSCTCPAWVFAKGIRRTCKHLKKYLGEATETARVNQPPPACWCGATLVRGQCQVHTRDWKGDEKCQCGRAFASCKAAYDTISIAQRKYGHQPRLA